jgi:hypothetical protein
MRPGPVRSEVDRIRIGDDRPATRGHHHDQRPGQSRGDRSGQPAINLRPVSPDRFEVVEVPASPEFPAGPAPAKVTLRQNGAEIVFTRKPQAVLRSRRRM